MCGSSFDVSDSNPRLLRPSSSKGDRPRCLCLRVDQQKRIILMYSSPPYCSNQQSTNQLTANKTVEGASLFHFFCGLQCAMQTKISIVLNRKGTKTTENGSILKNIQGQRFCKSFFIKNVCSLDHKALYMCVKSLCPALS